jgi:hypothetical protein
LHTRISVHRRTHAEEDRCAHTVVPCTHEELVPQSLETPRATDAHSSPLYKMAQYFHEATPNPRICKFSLGDSYYPPQCNCRVNSCSPALFKES